MPIEDTDRRRRIALFIRSLKGNGAERSTVNLANALAARGHAVDLVLVRASGPFMKDVSPRVRVIDLGVLSGFQALALAVRSPTYFRALRPLLVSLRPPRTLGAIAGLARYLAEVRPAALLSALDLGNVAAVVARELSGADTRLVLSQRNHFTSDLRNASVARLAPAVRRLYPKADAIVAVSEGVAADIAQACGLPRARVRTIYNAVVGPDLAARTAAAPGHAWLDDGGPPVILGVGKLKPQKDFATLIRAVAELRRRRPARLVILGEGPERERLQGLARAEGMADHLAMPGFSDNPFAAMARADVFALSSAFEGLPGVLIQALACGCPVVSTDCPSGPAEILEGGRHGSLVAVGDVAALSRALERTLASPPDRDALRRRAAFFSSERAADAYLDVLLARPGRETPDLRPGAIGDTP